MTENDSLGSFLRKKEKKRKATKRFNSATFDLDSSNIFKTHKVFYPLKQVPGEHAKWAGMTPLAMITSVMLMAEGSATPQEETRKSLVWGGGGPMKWLPPILVNDYFQQAIKGGTGPVPPKNAAICSNLR